MVITGIENNKGSKSHEPDIRQETVKFSGHVKDMSGKPLFYINVQIEGTTMGTNTDDKGYFEIVAPRGDYKNLIVSCVGFTTRVIPIGNQTEFEVILEESITELQDIMVVAYGTTRKESFTGSAETLNKLQISTNQSSSFIEALQGNVSGAEVIQSAGEPGASPTIRIRGIGSINASSEPLIVVNGVPYNGQLNSINPQDIESMSILKDAAATALYGSRAANGVIMITTKKGKEGKPEISFTIKNGVNSRAMPGYNTVNSTDYYRLQWEALYNDYVNYGTENPGAMASQNVVPSLVYNPFNIDEPIDHNGDVKPEAVLMWDTDWKNEIFHVGKHNDYSISASGGNENSKTYLSLGYLNQDGIMTNSNFKRYSANLDNQTKINSWLNVGLNLLGSVSTNDQPAGALTQQSSFFAPIYPVYLRDKDGNIIRDSEGEPIFDFGLDGDEDGRPQRPYWGSPGENVLGAQKYDLNLQKSNQASVRTFSEITPLSGLSLRSSLSYDFNGYGLLNYLNPKYGEGTAYKGQSTRTGTNNYTISFSNILIYDKTFNKHSLNVIAGHERYMQKIDFYTATKRGFDFESMKELAGGALITNANSYEDNYRIESYMSRLNYDFANRYYLSLSYRTDGSSRFHEDVRWGQFWSVGASWRISEEEFMSGTASWIDNLKLKASYGELGNDNIGKYYAYQQLYSTGHNNLGKTGVQISRLGTPLLTWEVSKTTNVGLEASFLNRFKFEFEVFNRVVSNMLFARPLPPSSGVKTVDDNIGDMKNTGWELNLTAIPLQSHDFTWTIDLNTSHYKNKITSLVQEEIRVGYYMYRVGGSVYDFSLKEWAGVDHETGDPLYYTDPQDVPDRQTTNSWFMAKYYNHGSALPKLFGGITNAFKYKGFELSCLLYYKLGGKLFDEGYQWITHSGLYGGINLHKDVLNRWTPENKTSDIPRMDAGNYHGNITSSRYLFDASYLRIRNLTIGYYLPDEIAQRINTRNVYLYLTGQNLFTMSKTKGIDPEASADNISAFNYPSMRTISVGLNFSL